MKNVLWKILLVLGIAPFGFPFVLFLYRSSIETWTLGDFLVLYSYLFWWTYLAGLLLAAAGLVLRRKQKKSVRTENSADRDNG